MAIYGLLRSITLIFNAAFLWVVYRLLDTCEAEKIINCRTLLFAFLSLAIMSVYALKRLKGNKIDQAMCFVSIFVSVLFGCLIFSSTANGGEKVQVLVLLSFTYLSSLGYTKFYRRFTLENLMTLLVCKELDDEKPTGKPNGGRSTKAITLAFSHRED